MKIENQNHNVLSIGKQIIFMHGHCHESLLLGILFGLKIVEDFIKNYNKDGDIRYFLEVDFQYAEKLHELYNYLPFLIERIKIGKVEKLVSPLYDKKKCVVRKGKLKQALN